MLAFDNVTSTNGSTISISPATNTLFSELTPVGAALGGAGNIYTMDTTTVKISGNLCKERVSVVIAGTSAATRARPRGLDPDPEMFCSWKW